MTLVYEIDGAWVPIRGTQTLKRMVASCTVTYHDGRQAEMSCEPYSVAETLDLGKVEQFVADGLWGADQLHHYGLRRAVAEHAAKDKRCVGEPRYVEREGEVVEVWAEEEIPPPLANPTPIEKLAVTGLSVDDLKLLRSAGA